MTGFDDFLRTLLFRKFCVGKVKFDFMEALLAACITGVGFALRTAFPDSGMPDMRMFMEEWYLAVCAGVLVKRMTGRVRRGLYAYGILMILPTIVMDGTIMGSNASIGALIDYIRNIVIKPCHIVHSLSPPFSHSLLRLWEA